MVTWSLPRTSVNAVIPRANVGLMKSQLAIILEWILWPHQCARRDFQPIDQPGQQETQGGAAAQRRQRGNLARVEFARPRVALKQRASFGDVIGMVGLEAPCVKTDRHIIGKSVRAGEIEINQA